MTAGPWRPVAEALARAEGADRRLEVWLRDDDAATATGALDRLAGLSARFGMPILLAVIPAAADGTLSAWMAEHPHLIPCQHGFAHANHAAPGTRACELGGGRALEAVLDDLRRGRERLAALFPPGVADILVPPWNRIDDAVVPHLPGLGFAALSTFGPTQGSGGERRAFPPLPKAGEGDHAQRGGGGSRAAPTITSPPFANLPFELPADDRPLHRLRRSPSPALRAGEEPPTTAPDPPLGGHLPRLNADLDIIDWRNGRVGRAPAEVGRKLADLIDAATITGRPIGLLTHHLVHDATAWAVLETMLERLRAHPAVRFASAADLLRSRGAD